ncbi:50S ribosomal protein P1 [Candidatus Woesearchaeota archaeon]|nr:50S ribosomal protein P1 [Candidatus Woesearchaeota archaeon]
MELIYASMLLHKVGQQVNEENLKKVINATGARVEESKVKAVVAALEGVNIDEVLKEAAIQPIAAPAKTEEKPKEAKKDEKKDEAQAAAGLGALFG